jgi:hypothetical protein
MLHHPNRDLYIVYNATNLHLFDNNYQQRWLNEVLNHIENIHTYSVVNEIIDINKYKIISKKHLVQQILREPYLKPFQFICCKN